jgi:thiol-disulfide isomerase/thioredoxin
MNTRLPSFLFAVPVVLGLAAGQSRGESIREMTVRQMVDRIRESKGSIVVFHLYASWCPPCQREFPDVNEVGRLYRGRNVRVLAVSCDPDQRVLRRFLDDHKPLTFEPIVLKPARGENGSAMSNLGMKYQGVVPYTAVFDPSGTIVSQWSGSVDLERYQSVLDRLLPKDKAAGTKPANEKATQPAEGAAPAEAANPGSPRFPPWTPYAAGIGIAFVVLAGGMVSRQRLA